MRSTPSADVTRRPDKQGLISGTASHDVSNACGVSEVAILRNHDKRAGYLQTVVRLFQLTYA